MKFKLEVPLFGAVLVFYMGENEKKRFAKDVDEPESELFAATCDGKAYGSYLWIKKKSLRTLAHEASHFADFLLDHAGVDDKSGEVRAYLVGWTVETIWEKIKDHG